MPRGGARPGAGRKPKLMPSAALPETVVSAFVDGAGEKTSAAPADWPFGTKPHGAESSPPRLPAPPETPAALVLEEGLSALDYFQRIYRDRSMDDKTRFMAAVQALPFEIAKPGVTGKKAAKDDAAKKAVSRFAPSAPPKLAAVAGRKV